jgi:hypothetical protein
MTIMRHKYVMGALLACSLMLGTPRLSYAISGCNSGMLIGTYNTQSSNLNLLNVLNAMNAPTPISATTTTSSTNNSSGGFGGNPGSLSGATPGLGRYYFDGNGNIVGVSTVGGTSINTTVGTYSVNADCTGTAKITSGSQSFNLVVNTGGSHALFIETDSAGAGAIGTLDRETSACIITGSSQTFAFEYSGGQAPSASSTTGGTTGGTTTTTTTPAFVAQSVLGTINVDGNGGFAMSAWVYNGSSVKQVTGVGSYSIGTDCSLKLSFNAALTSGTGLPSIKSLLLNGSSGGLAVQADSSTSNIITGQFVAQ